MEALVAADRDQRISTLLVHLATGEDVKLHRYSSQQPFQLQYIEPADQVRSEGFEAQTRNSEGRVAHWPTARDATREARRDRSVWKVSFLCTTGERVRLVRSAGGPFILDMMEAQLSRVIHVTRGGSQ